MCISIDSLLLNSSLQAASYSQQKDNLEKLQKRIRTLQKQIRKDTRLRDETQSQLEKIDLDIAKTSAQLEKNALEIKKSNSRIAALAAEEAAALSAMGTKQKQLAAMLKLAHKNQQTPLLKLFLSEADPAKISRQMAYYKYIMQAQELQLDEITEEVRGYVSLLDSAREEQLQLTSLQAKNTADLSSQKKSRVQRQALVAQLAANIKSQAAEAEKLNAEEKVLNKVIAELTRALENFPKNTLQNFKGLRGKLAWPVQGKVAHRYGQYRVSGQSIKWKGVFVEATRNTPVKAVAYGRVVYADWLPGLGLITIIDHGKNYFSMYANAEILYKEPGAWVQAGDVVATTGDSGGHKKTGLYFEIRRGKTSLNPTPWFKKRSP